MNSYFVGTDDLLQAISDADPDDSHVEPIDPDTSRGGFVRGRNVSWWTDSPCIASSTPAACPRFHWLSAMPAPRQFTAAKAASRKGKKP